MRMLSCLGILLMGYGWILPAGLHAGEEHGHEGEGGHEEEQVVRMDPGMLEAFAIRLDTAGPRDLVMEKQFPAEVILPPAGKNEVRARFAGIVIRVVKELGSEVRRGDTLAWIESDESLTPYPLVARMDGVVARQLVAEGEAVEEKDLLFVVVNPRVLWVAITVYPTELGKIRKGQKVRIRYNGQEVTTAIRFVEPILDEHTRTTRAYAELRKPPRGWKPGLFVWAYVEVARRRVPVAVAREALMRRAEGGWMVFVKDEEGFRPVPVRVLAEDRDYAAVEGLEPGAVYVRSGAFTLKAELEKGQFEAGHAH